MILIVEPTCLNAEHASINASMLTALAKSPGKLVRFIGTDLHFNSIVDIIPRLKSTIEFIATTLPPRKQQNWPRLMQEFLLWFKFRQQLIQAKIVIILSTNTTTLLSLGLISTLLGIDKKKNLFLPTHCN